MWGLYIYIARALRSALHCFRGLGTMYSLCGLLLLFVIAVNGGDVQRDDSGEACPYPSELTEEEKKEILDAHNYYRGLPGDIANVHVLTYNDDLASRAQDWANLCVWMHALTTKCDEKKPIGQNLFITNRQEVKSLTGVVRAWYNEKRFYDYANTTCQEGKMCGHYTQLMWAKSKEVGCAMKRCEDVAYQDGTTRHDMWVVGCNYFPPGNYIGSKPYKEGEPCSQCGSVINGGWKCVNNLCVPCTPNTASEEEVCVCKPKVCKNGGTFDEGECACVCPLEYFGLTCERYCECIDDPELERSCKRWGNRGFCEDRRYGKFMRRKCPETCGTECDLGDSCKVWQQAQEEEKRKAREEGQGTEQVEGEDQGNEP